MISFHFMLQNLQCVNADTIGTVTTQQSSSIGSVFLTKKKIETVLSSAGGGRVQDPQHIHI